MDVLLVAGGLVLLAAGGEVLVRAAVALARRSGLPTLLVGITIVAAATSMPEFVVSVEAALEGASAIAVGNVVGSNIANIALGLGIMGMLVPFTARRGALRHDMIALLVASGVLLGLTVLGDIGRLMGFLMVLALAVHWWRTYKRDRRARDASAELHAAEPDEYRVEWSAGVSAVALVGSIVLLVVGARLLLDGAVSLASTWGVSEAIIGASVVALGTSLPEIATTAAAAVRREHDVALGNLVGSCLFNLLGILGASAMAAPIQLDTAFVLSSGGVMFGLTALSGPWLVGRVRMGRLAGASLIVAYLVYIAFSTGLVG